MNKRKIIITGSEGVIGKRLFSDYSARDEVEIICIDKDLGFDLTDENQVIDVMKANSDAEYIVNLFAINDHIEKGKKNPNLFDFFRGRKLVDVGLKSCNFQDFQCFP